MKNKEKGLETRRELGFFYQQYSYEKLETPFPKEFKKSKSRSRSYSKSQKIFSKSYSRTASPNKRVSFSKMMQYAYLV